jgi:hypothetical protein
VFKGSEGRTNFTNLVSAIRNAAGDDTLVFRGTKQVEEYLTNKGITPPTSISELQALVERLNSCGF